MPKVRGPRVETRLTADTTDFTTKMKAAAGGVKRLDGAVAGLGATVGAIAVVQFARDVFDAGVRAERTAKSYEAITGSVHASGLEMRFVREEANRLGLVYYDTADAYKSLLAASRGTNMEGENTRAIFTAITEAGTALGLSNEEISGSLNAVTQMMSKGKVQAEELRGQLGERLPGAFQMAATAMGVTTAELDKMLQDGEVLADDLLPRLAEVMSEKYAKGAAEMAKGQVAAVNRMSTAWSDFKTSLSNSDAAVSGINAVTAALNDLTYTAKQVFGGATLEDELAEMEANVATQRRLVETLRNEGAEGRLIDWSGSGATQAALDDALEKLEEYSDRAARLRGEIIKRDVANGAGLPAPAKVEDAAATVVAESKTTAAIQAEDKAAKEIERINARMNDVILRNNTDRFDYQRVKLEQQVEDFRAMKMAEADIARYQASELKRISDEEKAHLDSQTDKTEESVGKWETAFGDFGDTAEDAFGQMGSSMKDVFSTGNSMVDGFITKMLQMAVLNPFENWLTSGGGFGGGVSTGGIMGFVGSLVGFANGGVSTSPGVAMVSEGKYRNEAHVPLPDGRTIPVTIDGAGPGGAYFDIDITIPASSGDREQDAAYAGQAAKTLNKSLDAWWGDKLRQAQRPGGMMNGGPQI